MPPKGKVPPQLRRFLFKKGGGRVGGSAPSVRSNRRGATGKPAGGRMASVASRAKGFLGKVSAAVGAEVRPVEMLISGGFGYVLPKVLDRLGAADMLISATGGTEGQVQKFFDAYWNRNPDNTQAKGEKLSNGGNQILANLIGSGAFLKVAYDGASKGKFNQKDLNFWAPFAFGQYLDAPAGSPMGASSMGAGSSSSAGGGASWV